MRIYPPHTNNQELATLAFGSEREARKAFARLWNQELDRLKEQARTELNRRGMNFYSIDNAYEYAQRLQTLMFWEQTGDTRMVEETMQELDEIVRRDEEQLEASERHAEYLGEGN